MAKVSQKKRILEYLKQGKSVTPIDALNKDGYDITTKMVPNANGKAFASYRLAD